MRRVLQEETNVKPPCLVGTQCSVAVPDAEGQIGSTHPCTYSWSLSFLHRCEHMHMHTHAHTHARARARKDPIMQSCMRPHLTLAYTLSLSRSVMVCGYSEPHILTL
jgi:hypothetical protein